MKKNPIILLHGWELRGSTYDELMKLFKQKKYQAFSIDLPGFGSEPLRKQSLNLDDYVEFTDNFLKKKQLKKVILIGHSFGGRIATKFAFLYPEKVQTLILTGTPVIRHRGIKKITAYYIALLGGKILKSAPKNVSQFFRKSLYFAIGEWDYYKAGAKKQVFKNIVSEDIFQYIKKITVPTILVWGEEDKVTPVSDVAVIRRNIPQVQSVIVKHVGHKLPYEKPHAFFKAIQPFL